MASPEFPLNRREMIAGLGAATLSSMWPAAGRAQARSALALQARADSVVLRPNAPATPIWSLQGPELRFKRGETLDIVFG
ncbi:MAG: copper oxidase, partial [Pseudolabrys sp.]